MFQQSVSADTVTCHNNQRMGPGNNQRTNYFLVLTFLPLNLQWNGAISWGAWTNYMSRARSLNASRSVEHREPAPIADKPFVSMPPADGARP